MFHLIRNPTIARTISLQMILCLLFQVASPGIALALTSGPGQEEFASFEPASTTDMVDLYTGDFNYNIPLLSVPGPNGGYPINLAYHSGIGMEQEASWVGLGWTLNVGAISRNLRGLPDDFNGDAVTKTQYVKEALTASLDIPTKAYTELVGFPVGSGTSTSASNNLQIYYNNYRGLGTRYTFSATRSSGSASMGLQISSDSQNGMGIGLSFNASSEHNNSSFSGGFGLGANYNSRQGLQSFNYSSEVKFQKGYLFSDDATSGGTFGGASTSTLTFATSFGVPKANINMKSTTVPFKTRFPLAPSLFKFKSPVPIAGSVYTSEIENNGVDLIPAAGYINTNGQTNILRDFSRQDIMYSKKIPHLGTSSFTYDLYTQTGQGTGSMFRPYLNTFGVLSDPQRTNKDNIRGGSMEFGAGVTLPSVMIHIGVDFEYGDGQNTSGPWTQIGDDLDWGNEFQKLLDWNSANDKIDYEPYYFQVIGEKTGFKENQDQLNPFVGDAAMRLEILKEQRDKNWLKRHFVASDLLVSNESKSLSASLNGSNQTKQQPGEKRATRATSIETLTTAQANQYGFSRNETYKDAVVSTNPIPNVPKDFTTPSHHISEISMLQPDGMRYVYGLPAYNNKHIDNVFAVTEDAGLAANYPTADIHQGGSNNYGGINVGGTFDEFVSKNEMPKYAHSWLLTSVFSADYLDLTGNGPTDDDYGYWVKFKYKKTAANYKWRVPFVKANYLDGYKNNPNDNKGSYTYGEKDLFVLDSIITKTHIAVFETSKRMDGYEASDEYSNTIGTAAIGTQTMHRLDKIKLYSRREFAQSNPTPTKIVNFEYTYDLCAGIPNNINAQGKLTLTKLYFTYQNSTRGMLSPYLFNYGNISTLQDNPKYDKSSMDRWGNYKNPKSYEYTSGASQVISYPYLEHPYTEQDPEYYTGANGLKPAPWTLKEITLPTGGTIKIEYEPDDYAYVENKQAMRMFDICGLSKSNVVLSESNIQTNAKRNAAQGTPVDTEAGNLGGGLDRVYFKLEKDIRRTLVDLGVYQNLASVPAYNDSTVINWFNQLYLSNIGQYVYFNIYSNIKSSTTPSDALFDYVKGYAEIDASQQGGLVQSAGGPGSLYGYFTVKNRDLASPQNISGMNVSPFTRASLEHLRAYRSDEIYAGSSTPGGGSAANQILSLFAAIPTQFTDLMATTVGFNNYAYAKKWGRQIQLNGYSTIRLCEPDYKKIGGGVRVKKISLNDNWAVNTNGASNSEYGQNYYYTKITKVNGSEVIISSGVAYEPQVGSEESALKSPIPYTNSIPLHGSYSLFMENPIMDSYYPGASVGYSKVTVESIAPDQAKAENSSNKLAYSAAPISIHEFYTPKDFPVIFDKTDMNPGQPIRTPIMIPGIFTSFTTRQAKSQGYSIILNDMAGKVKSITTKTRDVKQTDPIKLHDGGQIISRQKFIYNTEKPYNEDAENRLFNKVKTLEINKSNNYKVQYTTSIIGQTHDMFFDMNEDAQEMESFGLETNFDMQYTPTAVFLMMAMILPTIKVDKSSLRTVVFNKIINRTGILKQVETTTNESTIITENLAYDFETGEPILTKVTNEFKDPLYNFSYPGHWYYPNMAGAYQNFGLKIDPPGSAGFTSNTLTRYLDLSTVLNGRKASEYFAKGDLLFVDCAPGSGQYDGEYHVFAVNDPNNSILLMKSDGRLFPKNVKVESLQVLKSGFKNLQSVKVGGLAFKSIDPAFESYIAGVTPAANMVLGLANGTINNKIINASAVEYSNDWQVFCGPRSPWSEACICKLNQPAYDLLSMLQSLKTNGLLFSNNVPIYNMVTNACYNGFSNGLLNSSQGLLNMMSAQLAGLGTPKKFYYNGVVNGSTLYAVITHATTNQPLNSEYDCIVKIDLPTGVNWGNIQFISGVQPIANVSGCQAHVGIILQLLKYDGSTVNATAAVWPSCPEPCKCWEFETCYMKTIPNYACGIQVDDPINPYWAGMKGMWRPLASYAYNSGRTQNDNIREDGAFTDFVRFPWENPAAKSPKWVNASTITKYSPYGFELENKDALGNYSSALYGYKQSLVTAIGSNATYNEIAFDNFEDYPPNCTDMHFRFSPANTNNTQAHTGKYSMQVSPSSAANVLTKIGGPCPFAAIDDKTFPVPSSPLGTVGTDAVAHFVNNCDCLGQFTPSPGKKYVASVWTKELSVATPVPGITQYTAPKLKISITTSGSPVVYTFSPKGNVIDGWQQIFETFDIPANAVSLKVELMNTSTDRNTFFDDIRLHPNDGNMVSYVYDPITLKTMAELDANNFATVYIYDDEGHLNKVKKETTEGFKTIKEGRINTKKINE